MPMKARSTLSLLAVVSGTMLLGACAGDATAPLQPEGMAPTGASLGRAVNTSNGSYSFTIDPSKSNALEMGQHRLYIPAGAICDLAGSGYGIGTWNTSCSPQGGGLTITATVTTTLNGHPVIDFNPALRFSPDKNVSLYMWDARASAGTARKLQIAYCPSTTGINATGCIDEGKVDPELRTLFVAGTYYLYRRIKHFSGYVVLGVTDELPVVPQ